MTPEHIQVLRPMSRRAIALLFDEDEAGFELQKNRCLYSGKAVLSQCGYHWGQRKIRMNILRDEANDQETFEALLTTAEPLFDTKVFIGLISWGCHRVVLNK